MTIDLRGRRALVVGASGGIGAATADAFAVPQGAINAARALPRS